MKAILIACMGASFFCQAQTTWFDSFSDGSLSSSPTWVGDTAFFIQNADDRLQLNDSSSGSRWIFTPSESSKSGRWSGFIQLEFNPSGSNYSQIYIAADSLGNAVVLSFGGTSDDRLRLERERASSTIPLITSSAGFLNQSQVSLHWEVTRDVSGRWMLKTSEDSITWTQHGTATDSSQFSSDFYAIHAVFTKTRATKMQWDNLSVLGTAYRDSIAPVVAKSTWLNRTQLEITFSEAIARHPTTLQDHRGAQWSVDSVSPHAFVLNSLPVPDGYYHFNLYDFTDAAGNKADSFSTSLQRLHYRDIHFNELMMDPEPVVSIPAEYIELRNTTETAQSIENWTVQINNYTYTLHDSILTYLTLAKDTAVIPKPKFFTSFSSLPNESATLQLRDDWGELMDEITYHVDWHSTPWKANGGWALERDESLPLYEIETAWSSASMNGGSPGQANQPEGSTYHVLNTVNRLEPTDSGTIVHFTLPVDDMGDTAFHPISMNKTEWFTAQSGTFNLQITHCSNFEADTTYVEIASIGYTADLRFTELLFDQLNDTPEFIEFVNFGTEAVDLSQVRISKWDPINGVEEWTPLASQSTLLLPQQCGVLCNSPFRLVNTYPHSNRRSFLISETCPFLPEESGLCLGDAEGNILDSIHWSANSHHPLKDPAQSVSIYRLRWTAEDDAWTSTSTGNGNATPGFFQQTNSGSADEPQLEWAQFSPNNDGVFDMLSIQLPSSWQGKVCELHIFTESGFEVAVPIANFLVGNGDIVHWNGTDENRKLLPAGQYMLELRAYNEGGKVEYWHHGCLLTPD